MRVFKFFGIALLLVLFSCNTSTDKYEAMDTILKEANAIYQHPNGERFDINNDTIQLSPKLMEAASFFILTHDNEKTAKAFLLYGYAQKENGDKTSAMKSFKDAEYYSIISEDSLTTARAKFNIAKLLFDDKDYDLLLGTALTADKYFGKNYAEAHEIQFCFR